MIKELTAKLFNGKKNIVWGIGSKGRCITEYLLDHYINIDFYCDSDMQKQGMKIITKLVLSPEEALNYKEDANFLIATCSEEYSAEIIKLLENKGIKNYIVFDELKCFLDKEITDFHINSLYKVARDSKDKKLIIYGTDFKARKLKNILEILDIPVGYMIDNIEEEYEEGNVSVKPVYDLLEEEAEKTFIVLTGKRDSEKRGILEKLGFNFYQHYNYIDDYRDDFCSWVMDPQLCYNYISDDTKYPGIVKWKSKTGKIVIVTSGGSTTYGGSKVIQGYNFKSWPELLYEILKENGYDVTVINAACGGYRTAQELIKFERDILPFKVDILLQYTGYNDSVLQPEEHKFPFVHHYQQKFIKEAPKYVECVMDQTGEYTLGIDHGPRKEENFVYNVRTINSLCEEFDIKYHCFLQPNLDLKKEKSIEEKEIDWHLGFSRNLDATREFYEKVGYALREKEYVSDITDLFDAYPDVYLDYCHVKEEGNRIIAEHMYKFLLEKGWLTEC